MIKDFARYNAWANTVMASLYENVSEEIVNRQFESSFPSIRHTILHIYDAEYIWLKRMQGTSPVSFPSNTFKGNKSELLDVYVSLSNQLETFLCALSEEDVNKVLTYSSTDGKNYSQKLCEMALHCLNHSTYHRGQLIVLARQSGIKRLPPTDLIYYLRKRGEKE